ncbi:serine-threonine protein kinase, putative [Bodo saltans]|uniref:Serine-threonine protein kinase, putative n=1 Tax=Bodo saltans TaxID=75058 RepID=A0A0S4IYQ2_BODSA|nr:serine-threonine protein kinase, putative [Bodo saltans]|eukprot:CUG58191.1 serine-threonine protein kinase, putative [Bodo saltans]
MLTPRIFGNSVVVTTTNANGSVPLSPSTILTLPAARGGLGQVSSIAFSPRGDLVAAASAAGGVQIWSVADGGTFVRTLLPPTGTVATSVAFSNEGLEVAIGSNVGVVTVHTLDGSGSVAEFDSGLGVECTAVAFSASDRWIGVCSKYSDRVTYFTPGDDQLTVHQLVATNTVSPNSGFLMMQFNATENVVEAFASDGQVFKWKLEENAPEITPFDCLGKTARMAGATAFAIDSAGQLCCYCEEGANTICVRSIHDDPTLHDALLMNARYSGVAMCVAISSDMHWVALACTENGTSSVIIFPLVAAVHSSKVSAATISADGTLLVTATESGEVNLWPLTAPYHSPMGTLTCTRTSSASLVARELVVFQELAQRPHVPSSSSSPQPSPLCVHVMCVRPGASTTVVFDFTENISSMPIIPFEWIAKRGLLISVKDSWSLYDAEYSHQGAVLLFMEYPTEESEKALRSAQVLWRLGKHPQLINASSLVVDARGTVRGFAADYDDVLVRNIAAQRGVTSTNTPNDVLKRLYQGAVVLQFLHSRNCVHNNVAASNFLEVPGATLLVGFDTASLPGDPRRASTKSQDVHDFSVFMSDKVKEGLGARGEPYHDCARELKALLGHCKSHDAFRPTMDYVVNSLKSIMTAMFARSRDTLSTALYHSEKGLIHTEGSEDMCAALLSLSWSFESSLLIAPVPIASPPHPQHKCQVFINHILSKDPKFDQRRISGIVMIGSNGDAVSGFVSLHEAENNSRTMNEKLQIVNSADCEESTNKLKQSFVDKRANAATARARVLFGWYGTSIEHVFEICRDKPRSFRTTDASYFGTGSYFAQEASYAEQFCGDSPTGEKAVILFAISVSQAKVVTLRDYGKHVGTSLSGFSDYYSANPKLATALAQKCDSHFIPVRQYGFSHPLAGYTIPHPLAGRSVPHPLTREAVTIPEGSTIATPSNATTTYNVHYQAVMTEADATAHEIVIGSHHRCIPLAIVYFKSNSIVAGAERLAK